MQNTKSDSQTSKPETIDQLLEEKSKAPSEAREIFKTLTEIFDLNRWHKHLLQKGDYYGFIHCFREPEQVEFLHKWGFCFPGPIYWQLVGEVWQGVEVIYPCKQLWVKILSTWSPGCEHLMDQDEHALYQSLPQVVKIWRGCGHVEAVRGMSWTLDRDKAEWFASYSCGGRRSYVSPGHEGRQPILVEATVKKQNVLAYFNRRKESEIVVNPAKVKILSAEPCQIHPDFAEQMEA